MGHSELWLQHFLVYSTYCLSGTLVVIALYTMVQVRNGSRFEFLTLMLFGIMLTNLAFIFYMATYIPRSRVISNANAERSDLATIVAISISFDMIRYFAWQLTMWIFAFKYWQISIEIPAVIKQLRTTRLDETFDRLSKNADEFFELSNQELKYRRAQFAGIALNCVAVCIYGFCYAKRLMTKKWALADELAFSFMNLCGLISGCFFAAALLRINNSFDQTGLKRNYKTMVLHLLVWVIYFVAVGWQTFQVSLFFGQSSNKT
jgi:hypothetical protein